MILKKTVDFLRGQKILTKHALRFCDTGRLWISLECLQITQIQQNRIPFVPKDTSTSDWEGRVVVQGRMIQKPP